MAYGVTENGFEIKRFDAILQEMQSDVSATLGFDVATNPQSAINASILMPMADRFARLWEVAQDVYYAKFPSTAEGINLDNACQYGSIIRANAQKTQYRIHCTAVEGTEIYANSLISSNSSPVVQLACVEAKSVSRSSCNSIAVKVLSVSAGAVYSIKVNGNTYSYTSVVGDGEEEIIAGLNTAFIEAGYTKTISTDGKILLIKDSTITRENAFTLSSNLTTQYVVAIVVYNTEEYGDIEFPNNTITRIVTNIVGLQSVTNLIEPLAGRQQETDTELRESYINKSYKYATNMKESLYSTLVDLDGVKSVAVYENDSDSTVTSRPPHSFEVVIDGGERESIADVILAQKPAGIATYGSETVVVRTSYGDSVSIKFSRPTKKYIWVKATITYSGAIPSSYVDLVKSSVMETAEKFYIGDDVLYQSFINGIYDAITSTTHCTVEIGSTNSESGTPTYAEQNVSIGDTEISNFALSRISVVLV